MLSDTATFSVRYARDASLRTWADLLDRALACESVFRRIVVARPSCTIYRPVYGQIADNRLYAVHALQSTYFKGVKSYLD